MLELAKTPARELGPHGARVNAVCTGAVVSGAEERAFGDRLQRYSDWIIEKQCPKQRGPADDVAGLALFLASPESDFVPGQNVAIDGGW